jgi:hypothetical protein
MKSFPRMLSQQWNMFHVWSASDEIQNILNDDFEMVVISPYTEHARKLIIHFFSIRENWLLLAEHGWNRKSGKKWKKRIETFFLNIVQSHWLRQNKIQNYLMLVDPLSKTKFEQDFAF